MKHFTSRLPNLLRCWHVPLDGIRRLLYDSWQPLALLLFAAFFVAFFFPARDHSFSSNEIFCNANGKIAKQELGDYKPLWDPKLFFTINISFGSLSFTAVKIIDACWDILVGRGGQLLMGIVAYRVIRRSFTLTMERQDVPISTVTSIYCGKIQLLAFWNLLYDTFSFSRSHYNTSRRTNLSGRFRLAMQASIILYVLAFPTLVSVMTGYRIEFTGVFGYAPGNFGQLTPIEELGRPRMVILNGSRIGLTSDPFYVGTQIVYPENAVKRNAIGGSSGVP
jgi:hypothetical protein